MTTLIERLRDHQRSELAIGCEAADELERQAKEIETLKAHCDDAEARFQAAFKYCAEKNMEIEALKVDIESANSEYKRLSAANGAEIVALKADAEKLQLDLDEARSVHRLTLHRR